MKQRLKQWIEIVEQHGSTVEKVEQNSHIKLTLPEGLFVVAVSPTDHRADLNALAELRRILNWQRPKTERRTPRPARKPTTRPRREPEPEPFCFASPGPQTVLDARRRARLGLDGRPPEPAPIDRPRWPVLSLKRKPET
jgi:hypothetical protein